MRLARLRRLGAEALHERGQMLALLLLFLGELEVERLALAPLPLERAIAAAVERERSGVEVQRPVDRIVEQVAVVADHHDGVRIGRDLPLQPQRAFEIEEVGRLVEQQQVGLRKQRGRKRDAHAPAAGEFGAGTRLIARGESKSGENFGGACGRRMRADIGKPGLDLGYSMRVVRGLGLCEETDTFLVRAQHDLDQALGTVRRLLREAADPAARRELHRAVLGGDLARDRAEQGRLAGTIASDQPDAGAGRDVRRGLVDQQAAGDADRQFVDDEHGRYLADARARGKLPRAGNEAFAELSL